MERIYLLVFLAVLLAPPNRLPATEPVAVLAGQERMPAFSWDHLPLYVHIRKDTAYTDDEIRYLAKFPLITFEKANGHRDSGSIEAGTLKAARAVKAINPSTKILYYRNVIVHYESYAADSELKNIPGAFLVGRSGSNKLVHPGLSWVEIESTAVEIDRSLEVFTIAVAADSSLD